MASQLEVRPLTITQRRFLEWAVLAVSLWRVLGVRWTPIVTDDSLGYLRRGKAPFSTGFVDEGYRQVGYPLWLWILEHVTTPFGLDRLFGIVVVQRLLLIVVVIMIWRVLRLWAIPVLWFVTSAGMVVLSNFVLNEGVGFSLALLAMAGVVGAASSLAPLTGVRPPARPGRWLVGAMVVVSVAAVLKLQYVLLGLPIIPTLWALQPRGLRLKPILAAGGAMGVLLGVMVVGQTVENARDNHDPTPVSEQAHAQWWGAYRSVFHVSPELAERPEVQKFKGDGFSTFYFGLLENEPDYRVRRRLTEQQIDELFAAAGTTRAKEHWASFVGGLMGGRHEDLAFYFPPVFADPPETGMSVNMVAQAEGVDAVSDTFNDGVTPAELNPGAVLTGSQRVGANLAWIYPGLAVLGLVTALSGVMLGGRERWIGPAAALGQALAAAAMATGYIDIQRYLAPYVVASLCVGGWAMAARARRTAEVGRAGSAHDAPGGKVEGSPTAGDAGAQADVDDERAGWEAAERGVEPEAAEVSWR